MTTKGEAERLNDNLPDTKTMKKGDRMKSLILDTAETLFADFGYDGVSIRTVADGANISLGNATHHFPTKDQLFEAVIMRRAGPLTEARRNLINQLPADAPLEAILDAVVRPYLDYMVSGDAGWRSYGRLIAALSQNPRWTDLVVKYFGEFGATVIVLIRRAEPGLSREAAIRGYLYFVSVMMGVFASTNLLDKFSDGEFSSENLKAAYSPMLAFVVAGIRSGRTAT